MTSAAPSPVGGGQPVVLVVDQGTTNTKALLVEQDGAVVASASRAVPVSHPRPAWVEQDARLIWAAAADAANAVLAGRDDLEIAGLALSTQRESALAWSAASGEPLGPVLGWQDGRTAERCAAWSAEAGEEVAARTGLAIDPMFSAPKMRWLLDQAIEAGAELDDIRLGTVESWLIWRLTGLHLAEAGNASRTLLLDLAAVDWAEDLLSLFGLPSSALAEVRPSDAGFGITTGAGGLPAGVPVVAVMADSHAALYAQSCRKPGEVKATYGTGSSVMTPLEGLPATRAVGLSTTLAWATAAGGTTYALEGNILASGAAIDAVSRLLGAGSGAELSQLAAEVPDSGGLSMVPAFAGLGAPHWDRKARGALLGLTTSSSRAHVARATLEGVAHQIVDVVDAMEDSGGAPLSVLSADGGATSSRLLMQIQADLLGRPVRVSATAEASALGAALLAWDRLGGAGAPDGEAQGETYVPTRDEASRLEARARWADAVACSRGSAIPAHKASAQNEEN